MLAIIAFAAAAQFAPPLSTRAQGQVTIRIISGSRVAPGKRSEDGVARERRTLLRVDGVDRDARLTEFT